MAIPKEEIVVGARYRGGVTGNIRVVDRITGHYWVRWHLLHNSGQSKHFDIHSIDTFARWATERIEEQQAKVLPFPESRRPWPPSP